MISAGEARSKLSKAAAEARPGDLVYVQFDGGMWHLGRVQVHELHDMYGTMHGIS